MASALTTRLVRRALDALPVGLEIVGLEERRQRFEHRLAVDLVLALARDEIVGERLVGDAALAIGGRDLELLLDAEARDAGELQQIAAVAGLGELGDAADAADLEQRRLVLGAGMRRIRMRGSGWIMPISRWPSRIESSTIAR